MKKFVLICLAVCLLAGCGAEKTKITLYFPSKDGKAVLEEERMVKKTENVLEDTIRALLAGPRKSGRKRALPEGTTLLDVKTLGTVAEINLSSPFDTGSDADRLLARYTVVYTACTVPGVQKVKLLKDGAALRSLHSGEVLGALGTADISLTDPTDRTPALLTLYFTDAKCTYLYPETRQMTIPEGESEEAAIVRALLHGPDASHLSPVLHADTTLLSVETRSGIAFVNFGKNFIEKNTGDKQKETVCIYAVTNALCALPHIQEVRFLIEGEAAKSFGHFDLIRGFTENKSINAPQ